MQVYNRKIPKIYSEDLIDINVRLICKFMIGLLLGPMDVFQGDNFWFLIMVRKF